MYTIMGVIPICVKRSYCEFIVGMDYIFTLIFYWEAIFIRFLMALLLEMA